MGGGEGKEEEGHCEEKNAVMIQNTFIGINILQHETASEVKFPGGCIDLHFCLLRQ